jgi:hypothetical protein
VPFLRSTRHSSPSLATIHIGSSPPVIRMDRIISMDSCKKNLVLCEQQLMIYHNKRQEVECRVR